MGKPLIVTVDNLLVTIDIPPGYGVDPIWSMKAILSTPPWFSQLRGGTKNIPWLAAWGYKRIGYS